MASRTSHPSVLFIDKVFLKKRKAIPLRGVELFNLNLVRDLVELGLPVSFVSDRTWGKDIRGFLGESQPRYIWVSSVGMDFISGLWGGVKCFGKRFDVLLLGNVGNGLIPAIYWLRASRAFSKCVLIAHREATGRFVRSVRRIPGHVVAVNRTIAEPFQEAGCSRVHVDYGIMNAGRFTPRSGQDQSGDVVDFCVVGMLDNAWKGADTAVHAFRKLPKRIRSHCRLHLASFTAPPHFPESNIITYDWMPSESLPDLLRRMDVMLVPSRDEGVMRETFSQAIVQGMLTGLPVIASHLPILAEKLDEGGGLVYADEAELVRHMLHLAEDEKAREKLGQAGRKTALARYVWNTKNFADRYVESK